MAGIRANNRRVAKEAFDAFKRQIDIEVTKQLNLICQNILIKAIQSRLSQQNGHDYTGNLINSIVVVLYDEGEISNVLTAGKDGQIKRPISGKMYARKKPFRFNPDWSGRSGSHFIADIPTDKGVADADIEKFLMSNKPVFTKGWCITVAYTVEYAEWVEIQRQTTGYLESQKFAGKQMRLSFQPLKAA